MSAVPFSSFPPPVTRSKIDEGWAACIIPGSLPKVCRKASTSVEQLRKRGVQIRHKPCATSRRKIQTQP